ncbi:MAG: tRNA 2-thiouridine(34) synthase MnmA [Candidatus Gastranaerophilales bacterium]|nr:tRNA 2-thiouridine(34) synthase MnmA [Candidatus Gastranaerophilales bacterium]
MRVLVGMSGGVDSSMAALLLKEQGYEVIGATMSHWGKGGIFDELEKKISANRQKNSTHCACLSPNEEEDIEETKKIAEKLGIEFHVIDCSKDYEEIVINYFKSEYMEGRTPNPCICCNRYIKFGVFPELARKAGIQFDKFATGHYAKISFENNRYILKRGINHKKDQSYFLYGLSQEQLASTLLPLGDYTKDEIREIARKNGFEVAEKPDSQDFYNGDYNDILNTKPKKGNIVDIKGNVLGTHQGFWNFTIGQRKGIGIAAAAPLYVIELKKDTNEVVAAYKEDSLNKGLIASNVSFSAIDKLEAPINCQVKIRSSQEPKPAVIKPNDEGNVEVIFSELQSPIATGQSAVFYDNDVVLGGGIIEKVF